MTATPGQADARTELLAAAKAVEELRRMMEESAPEIMLAGGSAYITGRYSGLSDAIELLRRRASALG
ncbi:MAG: hypothetical protein LKF88_03470 [Microbacteriaceae bacterium]|nr:hypothetical protein [Microbacteriaceae bacterium]MCI1207028.1 hypothetical protein [Microbacteriaceae bacterium]